MNPQDQQPVNFPPRIDMAKQLANRVAAIVSRGMRGEDVIVPKEIVKERMDICKECEYFHKATSSDNFDRCIACGCLLKIKTQISIEKCPKKKWDQYKTLK